MLICGIQKLTLLDFPEKTAATIFTGGCNFRCPFCHNASLVTGAGDAPVFSEEEIIEFLSRRTGKLDGVCITGGEPLLQPDLEAFIRRIRSMGFLIKLDTNGVFTDTLARLIDNKLLDYIAMDVKNSEEKYPLTIGVANFDVTPIKKSIELIKASGLPYEFRTTLVRGLHTKDDIHGIGRLVAGASVHYLQNFEDSGCLVGFGDTSDGFVMSGFDIQEIEYFQHILSQYVGKCIIRG